MIGTAFDLSHLASARELPGGSRQKKALQKCSPWDIRVEPWLGAEGVGARKPLAWESEPRWPRPAEL